MKEHALGDWLQLDRLILPPNNARILSTDKNTCCTVLRTCFINLYKKEVLAGCHQNACVFLSASLTVTGVARLFAVTSLTLVVSGRVCACIFQQCASVPIGFKFPSSDDC
jgi:hypothetical protein